MLELVADDVDSGGERMVPVALARTGRTIVADHLDGVDCGLDGGRLDLAAAVGGARIGPSCSVRKNPKPGTEDPVALAIAWGNCNCSKIDPS